MPWIVAMTKPNHEAIAVVNLNRQGFVNYVPRYSTKQAKVNVIRPLFPRYIFIWIDQLWSSILGTRGISRVLLGDNGPATIADSVIKELRSREYHGLVQLTAPPKFTPGEEVKAQEGPFTGHLMIYEGQSHNDRVKVLINLLGRAVRIEIPEKNLIAA